MKFTSQRPVQFPIKPTPERVISSEDAVKHKMIETLQDTLPDFGKEMEVSLACTAVVLLPTCLEEFG